MFETIKKYLPWNVIARRKSHRDLYRSWEVKSGVLEPQKDNSIDRLSMSGYVSLIDEEQQKLYREREEKERNEKIKHVEDSLCASCKKKIKIEIEIEIDSKVYYKEPPIIKIVCNSSTVYRFHFDCWKSINSVLDGRFEISREMENLGE